MEWFLYDRNFHHGKVNKEITESCKLSSKVRKRHQNDVIDFKNFFLQASVV